MSHGYINLVVATKNEMPQWLSLAEAIEHARAGPLWATLTLWSSPAASASTRPRVRAAAVAPFADLAAALDPAKNAAAVSGKGDADISPAGARVRTLVIEARENLSVLAEMKRVLG